MCYPITFNYCSKRKSRNVLQLQGAEIRKAFDIDVPPETSSSSELLLWFSPHQIFSHLCCVFVCVHIRNISKTNQNLLTNSKPQKSDLPPAHHRVFLHSMCATNAPIVSLDASQLSFSVFHSPAVIVFTFHCPFLHQWQQWWGRI